MEKSIDKHRKAKIYFIKAEPSDYTTWQYETAIDFYPGDNLEAFGFMKLIEKYYFQADNCLVPYDFLTRIAKKYNAIDAFNFLIEKDILRRKGDNVAFPFVEDKLMTAAATNLENRERRSKGGQNSKRGKNSTKTPKNGKKIASIDTDADVDADADADVSIKKDGKLISDSDIPLTSHLKNSAFEGQVFRGLLLLDEKVRINIKENDYKDRERYICHLYNKIIESNEGEESILLTELTDKINNESNVFWQMTKNIYNNDNHANEQQTKQPHQTNE